MRRYAMVLLAVVCLSVFGACGDASAGYNWNENIDIQGIHLSGSAGNYPKNNSEVSWVNCWGQLEQGVGGRYYEYEYGNIGFSTPWDDPSKFSLNAFWDFRILSEEDYIPDFGINIGQESYIDAFGVSFHLNSDIRNYTEWYWKEDPPNPGEWLPVVTDDIELSLHFNLMPARIEDISLSINEWEWDTNRSLGISFYCSGQFVAPTEEAADALGSMFVISVPEPATVALLGLGGLFLTKRKCKASS